MSLIRLIAIGAVVIGGAAYMAWQIYKKRQLLNYQHHHFEGGKPAYFVPGKDGVLSHEECAICLTEMNINGKNHKLPCHHTFHEQCIKMWASYDRTCPLCRREFRVFGL
ncbi:hypothetical protein EB796_004184 [Bugula neritina]|uniref:RING-type domain-containing protein n=1 Tax=Bugula neritina TaxID=10212 RepID=A0A7J7KFS3_BUGNE|nr:hypothetical protein EB796_004184 [Bugula neritina]